MCHSGSGPPPADLDPRFKSGIGFGPPGPYPLADLDHPSRIWTPPPPQNILFFQFISNCKLLGDVL